MQEVLLKGAHAETLEGGRTGISLCTSPPQEAAESNEATPQPPVLSALIFSSQDVPSCHYRSFAVLILRVGIPAHVLACSEVVLPLLQPLRRILASQSQLRAQLCEPSGKQVNLRADMLACHHRNKVYFFSIFFTKTMLSRTSL